MIFFNLYYFFLNYQNFKIKNTYTNYHYFFMSLNTSKLDEYA